MPTRIPQIPHPSCARHGRPLFQVQARTSGPAQDCSLHNPAEGFDETLSSVRRKSPYPPTPAPPWRAAHDDSLQLRGGNVDRSPDQAPRQTALTVLNSHLARHESLERNEKAPPRLPRIVDAEHYIHRKPTRGAPWCCKPL